MAEDKLAEELFGSGEVTNPQPEPEPAPQPEPAKEPEPAPQPQPQPEPQPAPEAKQDHTVPLATFLDQRDELRQLRAWKAEQEAKQKAPKAPDPVDDPDGYAAHYRSEFQRELVAQKFENSDVIARQAHGDEKVEAALTWATERAEKDPIFAAQYMRERHPIDWIVRQHQRDGLLQQIGEDPDDFVRRRAAELGLTAPQPGNGAPAPAPGGTQQAPAPAAPPKSLVDTPSAGGVAAVPIGVNAALEAVFPG